MLKFSFWGFAHHGAFLACATATVLACSNDGSGETGKSAGEVCTQGDTRECVGAGACNGGQLCGDDGKWGKCECGIDADEITDGGSGSDESTGSTSTDEETSSSGSDVTDVDGEGASASGGTDGANGESDGVGETDSSTSSTPGETDGAEPGAGTDDGSTPATDDGSGDSASPVVTDDVEPGGDGTGGAGGTDDGAGAGVGGSMGAAGERGNPSDGPVVDDIPPPPGVNEVPLLPAGLTLSEPLVVTNWGDNLGRSEPQLHEQTGVYFRLGRGDYGPNSVGYSSFSSYEEGRYCVEGQAARRDQQLAMGFYTDVAGILETNFNFAPTDIVGLVFDLGGTGEGGVYVSLRQGVEEIDSSVMMDGRRVVLWEFALNEPPPMSNGIWRAELLADPLNGIGFAQQAEDTAGEVLPFEYCLSNVRFVRRTD